MFKLKGKKILATTMIFCVMAQVIVPVFAFPKKAEAFLIPIPSALPVVILAPVSVIAVGAAVAAANKVVDAVEKTFLEILKTKLLDLFVNSLIRWIQGEDDKPQFVTDLDEFLGEVISQASGEYIQSTKYAFLCQPFGDLLRRSLSVPRPGNPMIPYCTLNRIVGNIEDFYQNFLNGGWLAFEESYYPWNNIYGAYSIALEGQLMQTLKAIDNAEKNIDPNTGVKNIQRCVEYKYSKKEWDAFPEYIRSTMKNKCVRKETTTPGGWVAGQVQRTLNVDIDRILSAQEFTQYIAMILDAVINRLFKAGANGIMGFFDGKEKPAYPTGGMNPADLNVVIKYVCDSNIGLCVKNLNSTTTAELFDSYEECSKNCEIKEPETLEATVCSGCVNDYFVRGRMGNKACRGVTPYKDACAAFCMHTAGDIPGWNGIKSVTFSQGSADPYLDLNRYQDFFDYIGLGAPNSCTCPKGMDYEYGSGSSDPYKQNSCQDCNTIASFAALNQEYKAKNMDMEISDSVCRGTAFCENECICEFVNNVMTCKQK